MTARTSARGKSAPMFIHQRILSEIQNKILSGEWAAGRRIPVEHELMKQYKCSRMTVSKVLTRLAQSGLIERRRKVGSFVARPHSQSAVLDIPDIKAEVAKLGLPYSFEVLQRLKRRSARDDRDQLGTDDSVPVLEVVCRHMAGPQPFCLEQRVINLLAVPEAGAESFIEVSPGAWLLKQVPWMLAEHRIRAAAAPPDAATMLKIKPKTPCLIVERTTRSKDSVITFVRLTYPGGMHELVASFTPFAPLPDAGARHMGRTAPAPTG
jgi:GntR family histidine utilization transcriptional repressor